MRACSSSSSALDAQNGFLPCARLIPPRRTYLGVNLSPNCQLSQDPFPSLSQIRALLFPFSLDLFLFSLLHIIIVIIVIRHSIVNYQRADHAESGLYSVLRL